MAINIQRSLLSAGILYYLDLCNVKANSYHMCTIVLLPGSNRVWISLASAKRGD